jgi:putative ABC transport system permease protein
MIKNYIITALRSVLKNKTISLINITGLAIGLSAFLIILSYARHELSYDRFHKKGELIYRCIGETRSENQEINSPQMVAAIGPALNEEIPGIVKTVRFRYPDVKILGYENVSHTVKNVLYADSGLFEVFSFKLLKGDPGSALDNPYSIVLSEQTALKIFGTTDALGKTVTLDNKELLNVTGVVEDVPSNSHIQYNAFISFSTLYRDSNLHMSWNGGNMYYTYILLSPETDVQRLSEKLDPFTNLHFNSWMAGSGWSLKMRLQPLHNIYLNSNLPGEIGPVGNKGFLILLFFIALLIFVIAVINFINLTSVRLITRLRECGVRKVLGATKGKIILHFMAESLTMNLIALLLAFIIAESFLPLINGMLGQNLKLYSSESFYQTMGFVILMVLAGALAGAYPSTIFNSVGTIESLKNSLRGSKGKLSFKKVTVLLQYTVSISMIICSIFLYKQLHFIRHSDPGFDRSNVLVVSLPTTSVAGKHHLLKSEFKKIPGVEYIAVSSDYPGKGLTRNGYKPEGVNEWELVNVLDGDEDLLKVLGLKIAKGRNFSDLLETDKNAYLISETYARTLNWADPIGKTIERNGHHQVIGVFRDFNFASLHEKIAPLIISRQFEDGMKYLLIRTSPGRSTEVVSQIMENWNKLAGEVSFDYFNLDNSTRQIYNTEERLSGLVLLFTILAILIAFLGLFALSTFETERQTKNIGIRKVNGARTFEIYKSFAVSFLLWVIIAFVLACPLASIIISKWLGHFAYKTQLSPWVYLAAGLAAMVIALATISWNTWHVSRREPVEALRYE